VKFLRRLRKTGEASREVKDTLTHKEYDKIDAKKVNPRVGV
jgi:hypothetical protein